MAVQAALRSDIALVFDECTPFHADRDYTARSTERTHRWLDRCLAWHAQHGPEGQVVYGIVQGGTEEDLRRASAQAVAARDGSAGSRSAARWARTRRRCSRSSSGRSRSCRRPGRAICSASARSTISCAASSSGSTPSTARCRPGSAATAWRSCPTRSTAGASIWPRPGGSEADEPLLEGCPCPACGEGYSRAYLHYLLRAKEQTAMRLLTIHNLAYLQRLMAELRDAIDAGRLPEVAAAVRAGARRGSSRARERATRSRPSRPRAGAHARPPTTR